MIITCPLCSQILTSDSRSWRCSNGHCFDIAKQGYCNLLPVQNKRSREPGDNAEMVAARHAFLKLGHYAPVVDALQTLVQPHIAQCTEKPVALIDAGCGEGYYSSQLNARLADLGISADFSGVDISKFAIKAAAQRCSAIKWFVASSHDLPFQTAGTDILLSLFSPLPAKEFKRCLKPSGLLVVATTGDNHLLEMREIIYDQVITDRYEPAVELGEEFKLAQQQRLQFTIELDSSTAILQLLTMTPHYWRAKAENKQRLEKQQTLRLSIDILLHSFIPD